MTSTFKTLALFPGQGSQKVGMGHDLFNKSPIAQEIFLRADNALGFSLSSLCFEGPSSELTRTETAQPAILSVSYAFFSEFQTSPASEIYNIVAGAGHSLGEYTAYVAAGALSFEDAIKLVHNRGRYMQEAVPEGIGRMIAVLGVEESRVREACTKVEGEIAEIANINAPGQIVVAGSRVGIENFLTELGPAKTVDLAVSAPFHCSLMKHAATRLQDDLSTTKFRDPKFPIFSNPSARPILTATEIPDTLYEQVCSPVRWVECINNAITSEEINTTIEFGGNVLSGLVKRIAPTLSRESIDTWEALSCHK